MISRWAGEPVKHPLFLHAAQHFSVVRASAVIFDLDGTLLDSVNAHLNSWVEACALLGIKVTRDELERFMGMTADDIAVTLTRGDEAKAAELVKAKKEVFTSKWLLSVKEFPDAVPTLSELRKRGKKIAVATSTQSEYVDIYVTLFEVFSYVDAVVTPQMVGSGKPSPEMALKAARLLRVDPRECVVVGDSEHDVDMAKGAGMAAVFIDRTGSEPPAAADAVIRSLTELLSILE